MMKVLWFETDKKKIEGYVIKDARNISRLDKGIDDRKTSIPELQVLFSYLIVFIYYIINIIR